MATQTAMYTDIEPQGVIVLVEYDDVTLKCGAVLVTNPNGAVVIANVHQPSGAVFGPLTPPHTQIGEYTRYNLPGQGIQGVLSGSKFLLPGYSLETSVASGVSALSKSAL